MAGRHTAATLPVWRSFVDLGRWDHRKGDVPKQHRHRRRRHRDQYRHAALRRDVFESNRAPMTVAQSRLRGEDTTVPVTITYSRFENNTAENGGAIAFRRWRASQHAVRECRHLLHNTAPASGGHPRRWAVAAGARDPHGKQRPGQRGGDRRDTARLAMQSSPQPGARGGRCGLGTRTSA